jgi:WD40 repeat protein
LRIRARAQRHLHRRLADLPCALAPAYLHAHTVAHGLLGETPSRVHAVLMDGARTLERLRRGPEAVSGWVRDLGAAAALEVGSGIAERSEVANLNLSLLRGARPRWAADEVWAQLAEEDARIGPPVPRTAPRFRARPLHADPSAAAVSAVVHVDTRPLRGLLAVPGGVVTWGDGGMYLWSGKVGSAPRALPGQAGRRVYGAALRDGAFWSWGEDGTLVRRQLDGDPVQVLRAPFPVGRVAWCGGHVVVASEDVLSPSPLLVVFELRTGRCKKVSLGSGNDVTHLLSGGDAVFGADSGGGVFVLRPAEGKAGLLRWDAHDEAVTALSEGPDGTLLSSGGDRSRRWDLTGRKLQDMKVPGESAVGHVCVGEVLGTWNELGVLHLHRLGPGASPRPYASLYGHTSPIAGARHLGDERVATWADNLNVQIGLPSDVTVRVWNIPEGREERVLDGHKDCALGALKDGAHTWTWSLDGTVLRWDAEGHRRGWSGAGGPPQALLMHGDSAWVCTADGFVARLDRARLAPPEGIRGARRRYAGLRMAEVHVSATFEGEIDIVDLANGRHVGVSRAHEGAIAAVVPWDAQSFLTCGHDHRVRRWSLDGTLLGELRGHTSTVLRGLRLQGGQLLTWSWDNDLRLWDVDKGRCVRRMQGHETWVWACLDLGDRLLSWDLDGGARVWSADGLPLAELGGCGAWLLGMTRLAGDRVLAWGHEGTLLSWTVPSTPQKRSVKPDRRWKHHDAAVFGALVVDEDTFASWDEEGGLAVHRGAHTQGWTAHAGGVEGVCLLGAALLTWGADRTLATWTLEGEELERVHEDDAPWVCPAWLARRATAGKASREGLVDARRGTVAFPDGCDRIQFAREEFGANVAGVVTSDGGVHPWVHRFALRAEGTTGDTALFCDLRGALYWVHMA